MAHIHPIILCITRRENNDVVHDFDVITNWDLTILCPRVIKRTEAGRIARERAKGLPFTNDWRWGNFFSYSGWNCAKSEKNHKFKTTSLKELHQKPFFTNHFQRLKVVTVLIDYDSSIFIHYFYTTTKHLGGKEVSQLQTPPITP